ncbi:porin [Psychrobacter aestuarii]|uniref:Porin n=1 Tax=Psychrobacter aestuarii TaxID=556327 RepID=A0ABN0VLT9_9GAMM|nr:porin [Psychrobacter aestuarii]
MKKLLLASAVAALSVSAAQAAPTIYGKAFVAADYVNAEFDSNNNTFDRDEDTVEINSYSSRIGLKGSEAMTADTDVVYQLEYGIRPDGEDRTFKSRDTYLGVKNKNFGEVRAGRNQSTLDYINNVIVNEGYWDNLGSNNLNSNQQLAGLNMSDSGRINNSIIWKAPKYNNMPLDFALMYSSDRNEDNGLTDKDDGYGAALTFDQGTGFTLGVAYDKDQNISGDIIRGTATVNLGKYMAAPVTLGALYQQADFDYSSEDEKGLVVSANMDLNNFARPANVYVQYNNTESLDGNKDSDSDQIVVGGKYFFKDNLIMHAYAGMNKADNVSTKAADIDDNMVNTIGDTEVFVAGTGLEYRF